MSTRKVKSKKSTKKIKEDKVVKPIAWQGIRNPPEFDLRIRRKCGYYEIVKQTDKTWSVHAPSRHVDGTFSVWNRDKVKLQTMDRNEAQAIAEQRIYKDEEIMSWMGKNVRQKQANTPEGNQFVGQTGKVSEVIVDENGKIHCKIIPTNMGAHPFWWAPTSLLEIT